MDLQSVRMKQDGLQIHPTSPCAIRLQTALARVVQRLADDEELVARGAWANAEAGQLDLR